MKGELVSWWLLPDEDDMHLFNDKAERATIRAIIEGTCHPRSWSDIQSTWTHYDKRVHVFSTTADKERFQDKERIRKKKYSRKTNWRLVHILESNGMSYDDAVLTARKLLP